MALILVIDDQKSIRTIIAMVLEDLGHEVKLAEDGQKGIELFEGSDNFGLVITDIAMPNRNGNEVARHVRKTRRSTIPVVAITGFPQEADMELFDDMIVKPFKLEKLRVTVARLIDRGFPEKVSFSPSS